METIKLLLSIGFGIFLLWMIFGGLFESDDYSSRNTIRVDCSTPDAQKYSRYCNGDAKAELQRDAYMDTSKIYY